MTRFADELRGSEGEPCIVVLRERPYSGVIATWHDDTKEADVRLDADGRTVRVGYPLVTLSDVEATP